MGRIRWVRWGVAVLLSTLLVAGTGHPAGAGTAAEKLDYRLKWLFNTSVAGDLYADVHGIFKSAGLAVTVKAGGPERDAIKELELGHAQFGVASADQVIRALSKGAPVVVVAQLFQVNPLQWIYRAADPPIDRLEDLKGRILGITYGGNDETIMRTLLARGGIKAREVTLFSVRYDYTPFFQRKVDVWPVYRNAQGVYLQDKLGREGEKVRFFKPAEFGVRFVANSVVTSRRMIEQRPETVRRFVRALLQGWREAMDPENREKTLDTIQMFDKDTSRALLAEQLAVTRGLVHPSPGPAIGTIDVDDWQQTEKIMLQQQQIPAPVFVENVLKPFPKGD